MCHDLIELFWSFLLFFFYYSTEIYIIWTYYFHRSRRLVKVFLFHRISAATNYKLEHPLANVPSSQAVQIRVCLGLDSVAFHKSTLNRQLEVQKECTVPPIRTETEPGIGKAQKSVSGALLLCQMGNRSRWKRCSPSPSFENNKKSICQIQQIQTSAQYQIYCLELMSRFKNLLPLRSLLIAELSSIIVFLESKFMGFMEQARLQIGLISI